MDTLIKNGIIVTQNERRDVFRGNILVSDDKIVYAGKDEKEAEETIDASGKIIIPGLINTHAHAAMAHLKGKLDDIELGDFLEKTFTYDAKRTDEGIYNSAKLAMFEMIDSGITSFLDLYYSEDVIARAAEDTGIRAFLSWVTLDKEFTTQSGDPVSNAETFIREWKGKTSITPSIGIQGIYVANDETYARAKEVAEKYDTLIHTHLAETRKEVYDLVRKIGERPVEHLEKIGFLNDRLVAAHCVWVTNHEVKILASKGVNVSWNSVSNFKLGTGGVPPVPEMMENKINITLGTDSNGSNNSLNLFEEMKFSPLTVKNQRWDASFIKAQDVMDFATRNAGKALKSPIGTIEAGKKADIVILDARRPGLIPVSEENAISSIVYSANPAYVDTVMVNGRILKRGGKLMNFDPEYFEKCNFI